MSGNRAEGNRSPIGIFDSGIGGLTVARAIKNILPTEKIIYFGDTAHFPYGDKSPDSIKYYAIRITQFLLEKGCKMVVVACNTASSVAFHTVKDFTGKKALVVNVIEPVVKKIALEKKWLTNVGVIATKGTVKSDIYPTLISRFAPHIHVHSLATPLLASMIEEGFFNNKISRTIIHSYLSNRKLKKLETLILGCTHYPLIRPEIEEFYQGKINILDSSEETANYVKSILQKKGLSNSSPVTKKDTFYVSDYTHAFEESSHHFFGKKIKLQEARIWK